MPNPRLGPVNRGQTQALSIATLGPSSDVQRLDTISPETEKRYYALQLHRTRSARRGPWRGPGRREIGHGSLAERALLPVLPSAEEFPYACGWFSEGSARTADFHGKHVRLDPALRTRSADQAPRSRHGPHLRHRNRPARAC